MDRDAARALVYGMPYAEYKARHQAPASDAQLAAMAASVAKNKGLDLERKRAGISRRRSPRRRLAAATPTTCCPTRRRTPPWRSP